MSTEDPAAQLRERDALLRQAMASLSAAIPAAEADPARPAYHFRAPAQWMNDPNGPIFWRGWHHVFYQFNPYGDQWGNMHWGHARSRDGVDWEHLPVALWPSKARGEEHVFSGSAFLDGDGKPVIFYTSIGPNREPEQWMARPEDDDLLVWRKWGPGIVNPALAQAIHGADGPIAEWRDPFLFTEGGRTQMLVGGGLRGRGIVARYEATAPDLTAWRYAGVFFTHPDAAIRNIECPNIVRIGRKWLLLTSTYGKVESWLGEIDSGRGVFVSEMRGVLGDGSYASQITENAPRDERLEWAWKPTKGHKDWNGYLALPSVLSLGRDGILRRRPLPALTKLRQGKPFRLTDEPLPVGTRDLSASLSGDALEMLLEIEPGPTTTAVVIRFGVAPDGKTAAAEVRYEPATRRLHVSGLALPDTLPTPRTSGDKTLRLHLFLDRCALDVYADDGAVSLVTERADFAPGRRGGVQIFAEGGPAVLRSLEGYALRAAQFHLAL